MTTLDNKIAEEYEFAIIGGTGFADFLPDKFEDIDTDYGKIRVYELEIGGKKVAYITRHETKLVPDLLNMRGYMQALKIKKVKSIFGISASGRITEDVEPGNLVVLRGAKGENLTGRYSFTEEGSIDHIFEPYFTPRLCDEVIKAFEKSEKEIRELYGESGLKVNFHDDGFASIINGPRFGTKAEEDIYRSQRALAKWIEAGSPIDVEHEKIDMLKYSKHHVILMTAGEAYLARELGMEYCNIAHCTDYSSSPPAGGSTVRHDIVGDISKMTGHAVRILLQHVLENWNPGEERTVKPAWREQDIDLEYLASPSNREGMPKQPRRILANMIAEYLGKPAKY